MMKLVLELLLIIFLTPKLSWAGDSRHMVSLGSNGLNWSVAAERIDGEGHSPFKSVDYFLNNIAFNYAYRLSSRWQLGLFYQVSHEEYKFQKQSGGYSPAEEEKTQYGLFTLYNFSDDIGQAYYLGAAFSFYDYEEENSHDFNNAEGKAPFELDDSGNTYELIFGKRFSFKKWNISYITYAPQISLFYRNHGKDFDDHEIRHGVGMAMQIIKFDVIF